jgi:hypothetical protein
LAPPAPFPRANSTLLPSRRAAETSSQRRPFPALSAGFPRAFGSAALDREHPPFARSEAERGLDTFRSPERDSPICGTESRAGARVLRVAFQKEWLCGAELCCF